MTVASAVLFGVAALCLLQSAVFRRDFFGPVSVYLFAQCTTLGIAWLRLSPLMSDWPATTWAIFVGSAVAFAAGCACARFSWSARHPSEPIPIDAPSKALLERTNAGYDWTLHLVLTIAAFLFFCVGVYAEYRAIGTLIALSPDISYLMSIQGSPRIWILGYPRSSGPMVCMLCAIGCFRTLNPNRGLRNAFRVLFLISLILGTLAMPNRLSIFAVLFTTVYLFNFVVRRIRPAFIVAGVAVVFGLFVAMANLKGQTIAMRVLNDKATWQVPYDYVANNWWNLDYAVNRRNDEAVQPRLFGLDVLHGPLELFPGYDRIYKTYGWDGVFNEHSTKVPNLNTLPYQWGLYKDFGIAGCVAGPFLFGLFFGTLFALVRTRGSVLQLMLYAHLLFYVTFWFYDEFWSSALNTLWVAVTFLVTYVCSRRLRAEPPADPEKAAFNQSP